MSSPLLEIWPEVGIMLSGEVATDVDSLLSALLPAARINAEAGKAPVRFGVVIRNGGRLSFVRRGVSAAWRDGDALANRLDALVAADSVRAVAQSEAVTLRRSDGFHNWTVPSIHIRVDHRGPASYDFFVPLKWAPIRRADVPDPSSRDRIAGRYPHRAWPGARTEALSAPEAYERYMSDGIYDELHRAIEIAEDELRRIDDSGRSAAEDRLAGYLGARFLHAGDSSDLERAVVLGREAVQRRDQDALLRARLGRYLGLRFLKSGRLSALEEGIEEVKRAGADGPTEHAEILGELLLMRYRATAERDNLTEALETLMAAARRLGVEDEGVPARLAAACGEAYMRQFERSGEREALEAAIGAFQQAVDTTNHQNEYPRLVRGEAIARLRLYEITHEDAQLELAYRGLVLALNQTHDKSPDFARLQIELATAPAYRLPEERLVALLEAEGATPEAFALLEKTGGAPWFSFLARAVQMLHGLIANLPEGAPERPAALAQLATLCRDWFERTGNIDQLRDAASAAAQAAQEWSAHFTAVGVAQKLGISEQGARLYQLAVDTLLALGEHDPSTPDQTNGLAFELAEGAKSRLLSEQLGRGDIAAPPEVPAALVQRERALLDELSALDAAGLAARDTGAGFRPGSERRDRVAAELDEVWVEMDAPDYVAIRRGEALDLLGIRDVVVGGLDPGTGVLSLFVLEDHTALFFASADGSGFGVERVPVGTAAWRDALRRFQQELPRSYGHDVLPPTWEAPLRPLLDAAAVHLNGCSHLLVVPHGPAHALPWCYLTRDWDGPPAISTVSSLQLLDRLRRRSRPRSDRALVIGNPTGDLDYAEVEAIAVGHILEVTPLLGPGATRAALDAAAPHAVAIHLACHAGFDPDSPLDSHVVLCDGRWRARDALSHRLDAELVVLSGCETGLAGTLAGDELAGLAQVFLYVGARAVIVSLWRVSDAAAAEFMRVFHAQRSGGATTAIALQNAADAVRREREHPWYWAAFTLVGDGDT